jgi:DnaJ-class molecular chaperone
MDTHHLDVPCGFCEAQGRREIRGGCWLTAPTCPECGGAGYLVISPDAERLLAFLQRHLGPAPRSQQV